MKKGDLRVAFFSNVHQLGRNQGLQTDDAGDFTYFFFRDDTMETTYHIEFRYGSDLAALQQYMKGQYAYWLAAGIDANADAETIDNVIALFCTENLSAEE